MPSVGMRRNTRVFGARVLRSGRKLWSGAGVVGKDVRSSGGEDWIGLLDNSTNGGGDAAVQSKGNGLWHDDIALKEEENCDFGNEEEEDTREPDGDGATGLMGEGRVDKMWGTVYRRKRKSVVHMDSSYSSVDSRDQKLVDRIYGKRIIRTYCRKRIRRNPVVEVTDSTAGFGFVCGLILESSRGSNWFSSFLNSVLRYMRRFRVRLDQLAAFLSSQPISNVFSSHGVRFLQDSSFVKAIGVCIIYDSGCSMPSFSVHFSAVPSLFMHLHSTMLLRSGYLSNAFVSYTNSPISDADEMIIDEYSEFHMENQMIDNADDQPSCTRGEDRSLKLISNRNVSKLNGKTLQLRNRCIKKKQRSSLRSKRRCNKNYSTFGLRTTAKQALATDLFLDPEGKIPFTPLPSNRLISNSPIKKNLRQNIKELKSSVLGSMNDLNTSSCSANILVIESDKGYREEGAIINLETSSLNHWFLSVNKESTRNYTLKPQSVMRPYSCNRFTHAIIWKDDRSNGWMLEFSNRQDWFVFKELHRECFNRNLRAPQVENIIPVPVVREVPGYDNHVSIPFERPADLYISWKDDEVTRALENGSYEIDIDDEQWLNTFNDNAVGEFVSVDSFEKIIFEFEKGLYCSPEDYSDPKSAVDHCVDLERREVLEAVHSYWMKKRKQKRSALVKVFQCYQPRRAQLLPRAVLRKKRSSKRLARRTGRGKRHIFLKALLADQNKPVNDESTLLKVQEAKAAATRSEDSAILKRQRAQQLMLTAELATYKATMALRIAEAARVSESPDTAASYFFLD